MRRKVEEGGGRWRNPGSQTHSETSVRAVGLVRAGEGCPDRSLFTPDGMQPWRVFISSEGL